MAIFADTRLKLIGFSNRRFPTAFAPPLTIAPDAELNFLNFSTLVSSSGRFLAEEFSVKHIACGRDLLAGREAGLAARTLVAFANPTFSTGSAAGSLGSATSGRLTS